jgi:hypothetical protein
LRVRAFGAWWWEEQMSRKTRAPAVNGIFVDAVVTVGATHDGATVAQEISLQALELAKRARAAGMTTLCLMLETAALEAAAGSPPTDDT